MSNKTMGRRAFLKTMALMAGAIAAGPKVLASLEEARVGLSAASDKITYADFMNAVSYLEQSHVSSTVGYQVVIHPSHYAVLMDWWDEFLREEFSKQMAMGVDEMVLKEITPNLAEYVNAKTGEILKVGIVFSENVPEDEAQIIWATAAEDATLTVGVEAT